MSLFPFKGVCHTCRHDHSADQLKWDELTQQAQRIAELERQNADLRKDAERYQILRRGQKWSVIDGAGETLRADDFDAAVDAALQAGKEPKE